MNIVIIPSDKDSTVQLRSGVDFRDKGKSFIEMITESQIAESKRLKDDVETIFMEDGDG